MEKKYAANFRDLVVYQKSRSVAKDIFVRCVVREQTAEYFTEE
jgi:hypothetical protein